MRPLAARPCLFPLLGLRVEPVVVGGRGPPPENPGLSRGAGFTCLGPWGDWAWDRAKYREVASQRICQAGSERGDSWKSSRGAHSEF
eukprot:10640984-Heterocapsa_arctica.AAC.1